MFKLWQQYFPGTKFRLSNNSKLAVFFGLTTLFATSNLLTWVKCQQQQDPAVAFADASTQQQQQHQPLSYTNQSSSIPSHLKSYFEFGVKMIPHVQKRQKGGEDAYYADDTFLVVLDGVGGWANQGVDPGLFSKQLAKLIVVERDQNPNSTLKEILIAAVKKTTNVGSSTAVLARLDADQPDLMKTTNLGDSGYAIFRIVEQQSHVEGQESKPILLMQFRSKEQQYSFNFPYQCGTGSELPYAAEDNEHRLQENDVIVMGSDGLFDNVYDEDLLKCLYPQLDLKTKILKNVQESANCLALMAVKHGYDRSYHSPFAKGAQQNKLPWQGGKPDDTTVIVAQFHFNNGTNSSDTTSTTASSESDNSSNK